MANYPMGGNISLQFPRESTMAVAEFHLNAGNALNKMTSAMVIVPDEGKGPFPVLYLLHGLSDNHTAWVRRTSIERHLAGLPLIVVMPDGGRSFYTDSASNPRQAYETFIVKDLVGWTDRTFRTIPSRIGRMTTGLSMGGYGALKLALGHPDQFCAAVSFSGALGAHTPFSRPVREITWMAEFDPVWGKNRRGSANDLSALAKKCPKTRRPALRLDCGASDFLIGENRGMHAFLDKAGYAHEYEEHPGDHQWAYWDLAIQRAIPFIKKNLRLR